MIETMVRTGKMIENKDCIIARSVEFDTWAKEPDWKVAGLRDGLSPPQSPARQGSPEEYRPEWAQTGAHGYRCSAADIDPWQGAVTASARTIGEVSAFDPFVLGVMGIRQNFVRLDGCAAYADIGTSSY
jgi:hypothetical protein